MAVCAAGRMQAGSLGSMPQRGYSPQPSSASKPLRVAVEQQTQPQAWRGGCFKHATTDNIETIHQESSCKRFWFEALFPLRRFCDGTHASHAPYPKPVTGHYARLATSSDKRPGANPLLAPGQDTAAKSKAARLPIETPHGRWDHSAMPKASPISPLKPGLVIKKTLSGQKRPLRKRK